MIAPMRTAIGVALAMVLSACAGNGPAASPTPPGTTRPTASISASSQPPAGVTSAAQAAALVFASDPHFGAIRPPSTDLVALCCTYDASMAGTGFQVTINVGWGDCESGCISHHSWVFHVAVDGTITKTSEQGDPDPPVPAGQGATAAVTVHLHAGPTCPVEQNPPQSGCAPRPVANANVLLHDPTGKELATATSDAKGEIELRLPPGAYYIEAAQAQGLVSKAPDIAFSVVGGETIDVNLDYDTGIR